MNPNASLTLGYDKFETSTTTFTDSDYKSEFEKICDDIEDHDLGFQDEDDEGRFGCKKVQESVTDQDNEDD